MSYYTRILEKYKIHDCNTFEDVKNKFPDPSSAYLRKIVYLKGFKISKDGKLRCTSEDETACKEFHQATEVQCTRKKRQRYPKVNCPQCGKEIFLVYPEDPFCSRKCKKEFRKLHIDTTKTNEKATYEKSLKNKHCPECLSTKLVWNEERSEIMCIDCGFVGKLSSLL
jgi:endogenous inhibitor of DNA gyrase (YacG/DUF329 family)